MIEFIGMSLLLIFMARMWDHSRRKFELKGLEIEKAIYSHAMYWRIDELKAERKKLDTIWHLWSWALQFVVVAYVFYKSGLTWQEGLRMLPAGLAVLWIGLDIFWSLSNQKKWYYIGDGNGAVLERVFMRLSIKWRADRLRLVWTCKVVFALLASGWFIIF